MAKTKDSVARNSWLTMVWGGSTRRHKGTVVIIGSILIGLVLARFIMISSFLAVTFISSGIVLTLTVFVRKVDYLLYGWFVLTSLIMLIVLRVFPSAYYLPVARGIFWGLLVCVIAAWAIDNILMGRKFTPFDNVPLKATVLIFVLWCTATVSTSVDVFTSFKKLSQIIIALVASYMFYDFFCRDENNIKTIVKITSIVVILVSFSTIAVAIYRVAYGLPIVKQIKLWFLNPNILGRFLLICSPLLITSGFNFRPIRRLRFLFVSAMLLASFLSFSRAAWLGLLVSLVFLLWKARSKSSLVAVIPVLFVAGLTFPIWGQNAYDYFAGEQYTGRRTIWQGAWDVACDYPLLGTGPGNVTKIMPQYIDNPFFKYQDTHSLYLQNAAEMGFTSVAILLVFYVILLYWSTRIERNLKSHYLKLSVRGTVATYLAVLVNGLFETGSFISSFSAAEFHLLFPYILIGLPFAAKRLDEQAESGLQLGS
jgi:O-antigen ligase